MTELRLFVWTNFVPDYTDGLAFAIAPNIQEAQNLVIASIGWEPSDWGWGLCTEYPVNQAIAFACPGGS